MSRHLTEIVTPRNLAHYHTEYARPTFEENRPDIAAPLTIIKFRHGRPERFNDQAAGLHMPEGHLQVDDLADEIADEIAPFSPRARVVVSVLSSPLLRARESAMRTTRRLDLRKQTGKWDNVTIYDLGSRDWVDTTDTIDDIIASGHDKAHAFTIWDSLNQADMQAHGYAGRASETVATDLYQRIEAAYKMHMITTLARTLEPEPHKIPFTKRYVIIAGHETGVSPLIQRETGGKMKEVKPTHYIRYDMRPGQIKVSQRPQK